MKKDNCKKYQSVFNGWNKNRIAVETFLMSMDEPYIYVPKEGEEFRQCYLSDRKANRSQKFYKARHEMPRIGGYLIMELFLPLREMTLRAIQ